MTSKGHPKHCTRHRIEGVATSFIRRAQGQRGHVKTAMYKNQQKDEFFILPRNKLTDSQTNYFVLTLQTQPSML